MTQPKMSEKKYNATTRPTPSRTRKRALLPASGAVEALFATLGGQEIGKLLALWEHWTFAAGEEAAGLAFPLGHRGATLILGAEDAMAMQELSLLIPELLERVNAFLDSPFFSDIRLVLLQGARPLSEKRATRPTPAISRMPPRPPHLGGLVGKLDPLSPVTRSYEAYIRAFQSSSPPGR